MSLVDTHIHRYPRSSEHCSQTGAMKNSLVLFCALWSGVQGWLFTTSTTTPRRVCHTSLGTCYSDAAPYNNVPGYLPESPERQHIELWLFTRDYYDEYETLLYDDDDSIISSRFDGSKNVKIIIHGFGEWGNKSWVRVMREAILARDDVNVIVVHWKDGAKPPVYQQSVANTRVVGTVLSKLIKRLNVVTGASLSNFHLIGHSLGAHVAGYAGERLNKVGRITGLDPAGPHFDDFSLGVILDSGDAMFVDIIHTNAKPLREFGYGIRRIIGHVDFFPNGGVEQPGCPNSLRGLLLFLNGRTAEAVKSLACSHERGFVYFISSINGTTFRSYPCASKAVFGRGLCSTCEGGCAFMGYHADRTSPRGKFYLSTGSEWPEYTQDLSDGILSVID